MNRLPWMKFYPSDYLADTRSLTAQEKGCWLDLICHMYVKDVGEIETDYGELMRIWGLEEQEEAENMIWALSMRGMFAVNKRQDNASITVQSRRLMKDKTERENNRIRQYKHTHNGKLPPDSHLNNRNITEEKLDVRSYKKKRIYKPFIPPTPEQVTSYAASINYQLDGKKFCDHYAVTGWKRGGTKIVAWEPLVDKWKANDNANGSQPSAKEAWEKA